MEPESKSRQARHDVCLDMSKRGDLLLSLAAADDVVMVFDMVNLAYKVEDGISGVAFKNTDRFLSHEEGRLSRALAAPCPHAAPNAVRPSIFEGRVFLAAAASAPQVTLGCIVWSVSATDDGSESLYFGPLAVVPEAQGRGVGSFLVSAVERLAAELRSSSATKLRSVR